VVSKREESICFGGMDKFCCDLVDSTLEVMKGDLGDGAILSSGEREEVQDGF
jgi:hypothetical protein